MDPQTIQLALAIVDLSIKALMRLQWLFERPGTTFSSEEQATINGQLAEARARLDAAIAKMEARPA